MTSVREHGARKSMRAIPLTQRQRKQGKPPERALSALPQKKQALRRARAGEAALSAPTPSAPPASPSLRPASPLDLNAESGVPQALEIPVTPVETLDARERSAPPVAETHAMVMTPSPETDVLVGPPSDPGASPRRVKVRVRRKVQAPPIQDEVRKINMEMEETTILPSLLPDSQSTASAAALNIVLNAETTRLSPAAAPDLTREAAPSVKDAPPIDAAPIAEATPPVEDTPITKSALDTETTILAPSAVGTPPPMTDDAAPEPRDAAPADAIEEPREEQPEPELRQAVNTRKLPTLAVMAALASRAEARAEASAEASALEEAQAEEAPEPVKAEEASDAAIDETPVSALDATPVTAPVTAPNEAPPTTPEPSDATPMGDVWTLDAQALIADAPAHRIPTEPPVSPTSVTRPGVRGLRPASQLLASAPAPDAPSDPATSSRRRMWWLNATHPAGEDGEDREESDALSGQAGLSAGAEAAPWGAPWAQPATGPRARPASPETAPRRAPPITRQLDRWPETARDISPAHRARLSTEHASAVESYPARLLVWIGGAQAALCGTAALVAVIALLNGTAGARAVSVFSWSITFALIAGTGAGLGHLAWSMKRPRLSVLTLLLSQLGLLAWTLGLLGARPALMLLVPFGVALALRGLGRAAAVMVGLAALALYELTLALGIAGMWTPAVTLPTIAASALDAVFVVIGLALTAMMLTSLYATGEHERARIRAIERAARLATIELDALRTRTEDDAEALRRALTAALHGAPSEGVRAEGALSPLAEQVSAVAERLVDLSYERDERKRLESAARRLIRNIERAWLGLSWSWPEASGVILDDLVALLRTPPPSEPAQLPEDTTPTGQVVAPHLYRAWLPGVSIPSQPLAPQLGLWPNLSAPSQPSGVWPALWPSEPELTPPGADSLALPPSPRWRGPDSAPLALENANDANDANDANGSNGSNGFNGAHHSSHPEAAELDTTLLWP